MWGGRTGREVRGEEGKGPGRRPSPEGTEVAGPPIEDGNAPGGGGLDAKEAGCVPAGGPIGLADIGDEENVV